MLTTCQTTPKGRLETALTFGLGQLALPLSYSILYEN